MLPSLVCDGSYPNIFEPCHFLENQVNLNHGSSKDYEPRDTYDTSMQADISHDVPRVFSEVCRLTSMMLAPIHRLACGGLVRNTNFIKVDILLHALYLSTRDDRHSLFQLPLCPR